MKKKEPKLRKQTTLKPYDPYKSVLVNAAGLGSMVTGLVLVWSEQRSGDELIALYGRAIMSGLFMGGFVILVLLIIRAFVAIMRGRRTNETEKLSVLCPPVDVRLTVDGHTVFESDSEQVYLALKYAGTEGWYNFLGLGSVRATINGVPVTLEFKPKEIDAKAERNG